MKWEKDELKTKEVVFMPTCEFCERTFEKGPYKRILRGKDYVFCSASCFVLYHYRVPKFDMDRMYRGATHTIPADVSQKIIEEVKE